MNMNEFAKEIRKHNEKDVRWCVINLIAFVCTGFVEVFGKIGFPVFGSIMVSFWTLHYLNSYLSVVTYVGIGEVTCNDNFYSIAKIHAFPIKKYFDFLRKKLVVWQVAIFISGVIIASLNKNYIGIIFAVIMGLIPSVVCLIVEKHFKKKAYKNDRLLSEFLGGVVTGITSILEGVISLIYILLGFFIIYAIISDGIFGRLKENIIFYRTYEVEASFNTMIILFVVAIIFWAYRFIKKAKLIRIIVGAIFVISVIVDIVMQNNMYTEIYEDKIVVSNFERKKEYPLTEIESFKVYEEDYSLQVKVVFKDGFSETLFGSVSTSTEVYDEKYFSEYNFIADMIPKFIENGAKGEIDMEDMEELRETNMDLDKEINVGLEKIIELMKILT